MDMTPFNPRSDAVTPRDPPGLGDDIPCETCGAVALDTGLECDECGHDNWQAVTGTARRPTLETEMVQSMAVYDALMRDGRERRERFEAAQAADAAAKTTPPATLPEPDFLLDSGRLRCYYGGTVAKLLAAQREQMIADGWRQTRYVAPVTDCEACLTPDACAIRGQCAHYLRERA